MRAFLAATRGRLAVFGVVLVVVGGITGVALLAAVRDEQKRSIPTAATARDRALDLGSVLDVPHIVFRSTAPGPTDGHLAAVPLDDPGGPRSVSDMSCERVYATAVSGICLSVERGAVTTYHADLLDGRLADPRPIPTQGIPSRARISADGSLAATTAFISGHGYGTINFATETVIVDRTGRRSVGNLEKTFTTWVGGRKVTAADLNVWGVTFAHDPNTFYATIATGGRTWLVRGDLAARTLTSLREDAECPSLSPDGTTILYKKRDGAPTKWLYHVYDVASGTERPLSETRNVDDQAEWLGDDHVLYAIPRGEQQSDVWVADVRSGARPRLFLPNASSPAVVRTAASAAPEDVAASR